MSRDPGRRRPWDHSHLNCEVSYNALKHVKPSRQFVEIFDSSEEEVNNFRARVIGRVLLYYTIPELDNFVSWFLHQPLSSFHQNPIISNMWEFFTRKQARPNAIEESDEWLLPFSVGLFLVSLVLFWNTTHNLRNMSFDSIKF